MLSAHIKPAAQGQLVPHDCASVGAVPQVPAVTPKNEPIIFELKKYCFTNA